MTGKVLAVTFWDHAQDSNDPIKFVVYGYCVEATNEKVVLDTWAYADEEPPADPEPNVCRFVIVREAIIGIELLVPSSEEDSESVGESSEGEEAQNGQANFQYDFTD